MRKLWYLTILLFWALCICPAARAQLPIDLPDMSSYGKQHPSTIPTGAESHYGEYTAPNYGYPNYSNPNGNNGGFRLPNANNTTIAPVGNFNFGCLKGEVVDSSGRPLSGASVQLQCGLRTTTGTDGSFFLTSVPDGPQSIHITKPGYKTGMGNVNVPVGQTRTLKVSLSKTETQSGQSTSAKVAHGDFDVVGQAMHVGPRDRRVWVYKIEVEEVGYNSRCWKNTWFDDVGQSHYTLHCDNAVIGHRYRIKIVWRFHGPSRREVSNDWEVEFTRSGQTFSYDHPS